MSLFTKQEKSAAQTVIEEVLAVKKNERALIIANPETTSLRESV